MAVRLLITALLLLPAMAWGQRQDLLARSELTLGGGGMFYIGDLNDQSALTLPQWGASVGWKVRLDNRWALRLQGTYGRIASGDKDCIELRNLRFRSDILEVALLGEFNFAPFGNGPKEKKWTPYVFGGVAVYHFNPMAPVRESDGTTRWVALQPLGTEGQYNHNFPDRKPYPLTQVCVPFGVGVKWRLGKHFSLAAEYGFRKTWTDYLDDVSTTYVGTAALLAGTSDGAQAAMLADRSNEVVPEFQNAPGIKRGDDSLDDMYSYLKVSLGISLETLFGWMRSKKCRN